MPVPANMSRNHITTWLIDRVANHTGLPLGDISAELPLANYGLDSVQAVSLSVDIEDEFGLALPPTLTWDYPTIEKLAQHLAEMLSGASTSDERTPEPSLVVE